MTHPKVGQLTGNMGRPVKLGIDQRKYVAVCVFVVQVIEVVNFRPAFVPTVENLKHGFSQKSYQLLIYPIANFIEFFD